MIQWNYQHQQKQLWQHWGLMFPGNEPSRALSSQTGVFHGITFAKVKLQEGGGAQSPTSIPPHPTPASSAREPQSSQDLLCHWGQTLKQCHPPAISTLVSPVG